jgi:hypothetical protein
MNRHFWQHKKISISYLHLSVSKNMPQADKKPHVFMMQTSESFFLPFFCVVANTIMDYTEMKFAQH